MKTTINHTAKKKYIEPQIECVKLDNEISLILESTPPIPGGWEVKNSPEHFNNDPFKNSMA